VKDWMRTETLVACLAPSSTAMLLTKPGTASGAASESALHAAPIASAATLRRRSPPFQLAEIHVIRRIDPSGLSPNRG
jgi:hypothetical protein